MDEQQPSECNDVELTQSSSKIQDAEENVELAVTPIRGNCISSLASTTSKCVRALISLGIILTHVLLLWGQVDPMWSVYVCKCISHIYYFVSYELSC